MAITLLVVATAVSGFGAPQLEITPQFQPFIFPAGGGGDSALPTLSQDGRFVLFASTANNLVLTSNNTPIPIELPTSWNTYRHDRWSNTTDLASLDVSGASGGNGDSFPKGLSGNGGVGLFESGADNLVLTIRMPRVMCLSAPF